MTLLIMRINPSWMPCQNLRFLVFMRF